MPNKSMLNPPSRLSWFFHFSIATFLCLAWGCGPTNDRNPENPLVICEGEDCEETCNPEIEECDPLPGGGCRLDSNCPEGRYCSDGACVTEQFICTQLGCNSSQGVCDPVAKACVNAETCYSPNDCTNGFYCIDQSCESVADACSICEEGLECRYILSSMTLRCVDPLASCTADDASCVDERTSRVCSEASGEYQNVDCGSRGCNTNSGLCNRPPGDGCFAAIDATNGYNGSVEWSSFTNDYQLEPTTSCVTGDAIYNTFGSDTAFVINLPPGQTVFSTMRTPSNFGALYFVTDCASIEATCLNSSANLVRVGTEYSLTVSYKNDSAETRRIYLIADSGFGSQQGPGLIEIGTGELICGPGSARCNGDAREVCSASGMQYTVDTNCPFGCNEATNQCNPATNNECSGALDILGAGGTFTGNLSDFSATYDPGSACPGSMFRAPGRDALFFVQANAGDRVTARMSTTFDAVLWSMTDCNAPGPSCVGGVDSGNPETLIFIAPTTGRYYIVADAYSATTTGNFTLDVFIDEPVCTTPGEILGCKNNNSLEYCENTGFPTTHICSTTCSDSMCAEPRGDICYDAVTLTPGPGATFNGNFGNYTNKFNPGTSSCIVNSSDAQPGRDAVFAIQLQAGEILEANLSASSSLVGMYILDDCTSITNVAEACVYAAPRSKSLEFYAAQSQIYYLVVDSTSSTLSEDFTLSVNKRAGQCQPDTGSCSAGTLTLCNIDGSEVLSSVTCAHGCSGTSCAGPATANDTCPSAYLVSGSVRIQDSFDRFASDYSVRADGCVGTTTPGKEAVYRVNLTNNQAVRARVRQGTTQTTHAVYIVKDCADITGSCVSGSRAVAGLAEAGYVASGNETVYVIVDSTSSSNSGTFILDIDIRTAECNPADGAICESATTALTCLDYGFYARTSCYFGCSEGACLPPENDTCAGAINATQGIDFSSNISYYSDSYNPRTGVTTSCTGHAAEGPDSVYYVDAQQGDVIRIAYDAPWDNSLWITTDCANAGPQCVAGVDAIVQVENLTYTATATRRYYIIADSFSSNPTGNFNVKITVN